MRVILYIIFFLSCQVSTAQSYMTSIRTYGVSDGVSSRNINCFYKANRGFAWIGTNNGLNRFDGSYFKVYNQSKYQLSSNVIQQIAQDTEGNLWLLCGKDFGEGFALDIFNPTTEKRTSVSRFLKQALPFKPREVAQIITKGQNIWITTFSGALFRYADKKLVKCTEIATNNTVKQFFPISDNGGWLVSDNKLIRLDNQFKIVEEISSNYPISKIEGISHDMKPYFVVRDGDAIQRGSATVPVYLYHGKQQIAQFPNDYTNLIAINTIGSELWLASPKFADIAVADLKGNILEKHSKSFEKSVSTLAFLKKELWYYLNNEKIALVQTAFTPFQKLLHNWQSIYKMNYGVRGMALLDSELIVNGLGYSYSVNLRTQEKKQFATNLHYYNKTIDPDLTNGLAIMKDRAGNLWLTDEKIRLAKYNPQNQQFSQYKYTARLQANIEQNIEEPWRQLPVMQWSLFEDQKGTIWIGHQNGLSFLSSDSGSIQLFDKYNGYESLKSSAIFHFFETEKGVLLSTSTGIYLLDIEKGIIDRFHSEAFGKKQIPHNIIAHMQPDTEACFWLASKGGGLIRWNMETGECQQFTTVQGLSDNTIYAVYLDDYGKLWLSSSRGIMRFDKKSREISTYLPENGASHEEFNTISHFKAPDGTIYFGSLNGITAFHPKNFELTSQPSHPFKITGFRRQSAQSGEFKDETMAFLKSGEIILQPSDLGFALDFSYLSFQNDKKQYAYRVEGIDKEWSFQNQSTLRFNRLPYGSYKLQLKAQGDLGIWETPIYIPIIQLKPVYLQNWFVFLAIIIFFLITWLSVRLRTRQLKKSKKVLAQEVAKRTAQIAKDKEVIEEQSEKLATLDKLKSKFFANISHELRTPLTMVLAPISHLLQGKNLQKEQSALLQYAQRNGQGLLKKVNEILDLSKLESEKLTLDLSTIHYKSFCEQVLANFQYQAVSQRIKLSYQNDLPTNLFIQVDTDRLEKIVNNLLSNALKFTLAEGTVSFRTWQDGNMLKIAVQDSGMGIPQSDLEHVFERFYQSANPETPKQSGTGIGLALSKELAQLMGGTLSAESQWQKGSVFTLSIPLKKIKELTSEVENSRLGNAVIDKEVPKQAFVPAPFVKEKPTLLMVEDNADMQSMIALLLQPDYNLLLASDGQQAIDFISVEGNAPDIILSDIMMPNIDGFALLDYLKNNPKWSGIPVMMLTAKSAEEDKLHALMTGVDDYLTKPFSPKELSVRLQNLLNHYQARQDWQAENPAESETETQSQQIQQEWVNQVREAMLQSIGTHHFGVQAIAEEMGMSERHLRRKLKQLTGLSPVKFQQEVQLQQARKYLESQEFASVAELSIAIGFQTSKYFSKLFKARFGKNPSEYF